MRLVNRIGINDITTNYISKSKCYILWNTMLQRCYSIKHQKTHTTYKDCEIDIRWQRLSEFKKWFNIHYIEGYQLDKDLFIPNNKIYGADTCIFIPQYLNILIKKKKDNCVYKTQENNYQVRVTKNGIKGYGLGTYDNIQDANNVANIFAYDVLCEEAEKWVDVNDKIFYGLLRHSEKFINNNWIETLECY